MSGNKESILGYIAVVLGCVSLILTSEASMDEVGSLSLLKYSVIPLVVFTLQAIQTRFPFSGNETELNSYKVIRLGLSAIFVAIGILIFRWTPLVSVEQFISNGFWYFVYSVLLLVILSVIGSLVKRHI